MSSTDEFIARVEAATGHQGRKAGKNIRLLCPAHDDRNPSLDVMEGRDGQPVVICRAGCTYEAICDAIGWESAKRASSADPFWTPAGRAEAIYEYTGTDGQLLLQVCRLPGKKFLQRRPDPSTKSGWRYDRKGVPHVLYRLSEVRAAIAAGRTVYVCEGEKDAETLRTLGLVATCNPGGAGKWLQARNRSRSRGSSDTRPDRAARAGPSLPDRAVHEAHTSRSPRPETFCHPAGALLRVGLRALPRRFVESRVAGRALRPGRRLHRGRPARRRHRPPASSPIVAPAAGCRNLSGVIHDGAWARRSRGSVTVVPRGWRRGDRTPNINYPQVLAMAVGVMLGTCCWCPAFATSQR